MITCLVCGELHDEINDNDPLKLFCLASRKVLLPFSAQPDKTGHIPGPLCKDCCKEFESFLKIKGPLIGAEFLSHISHKLVQSLRTKEGLKLALLNGKKLGRPKIITQPQINKARELRENGKTWREINKITGLCNGQLQRIFTNKI